MAATALINVIGVVSGVVTITGFAQSNLPGKNEAEGAVVRVAVGLDSNGLSNAGGDRPYVVGFNENGEAIGLTEGGDKIGNGKFADMILDQNAAGTDKTTQQPTYLQFTPSGNDAVCIAYISVTWQDGQQRGWLGDMGEACDYRWYPSNIVVGDKGHKTGCIWLDKDHSEDIWLGGMQIHTEDFLQKDDDYSKNKDHYCNYPAMLWKHEGDEFDGIKKKRSLESRRGRRGYNLNKRTPGLESQLVTSSDPVHSAKSVCTSETSYGPDFISIPEGVYCDMANKQEWPLCNGTVGNRCFDTESHTVRDGKRWVMMIPHRSFGSVLSLGEKTTFVRPT